MNKLLTFKRRGKPETPGEPLHYKASGLDDVYLLNGFEVETIDGEEYVTIEDLDGLWKAIGLHLVTTRKDLAPKEIKFLRHHMDLTQAELADRMRVTDQTVARWEKGITELSGPADIMLRTRFLGSKVAQPEGNELLKEIIKLWDELFEHDESETKPAVFEHGKKWKESRRELEGKIRRSSGANATTAGGRGELMVEARRLAKIYVKAALKEEGLRAKPAEITEVANEMIANDPTIMEQAKVNIEKRHGKRKGKKIIVAALKSRRWEKEERRRWAEEEEREEERRSH